MSLWLERVTAELSAAPTPLVMCGGVDWGLAFVLSALQESEPLAWIAGTPRERDDPVAQGNSLAAALNVATRTSLFPTGLTPHYHLTTLVHYGRELAPVTIALTAADHAPETVRALLDASLDGLRVIIDFEGVESIPEGCRLYPSRTLELSVAEALDLTPVEIPRAEALTAWRRTSGRRPSYRAWIDETRGQEPELIPGPAGPQRQPEDAVRVAPEVLIAALMRNRRYGEALEVAVQAAPDQVEDLLLHAGPDFQRRGLLARLHLLLTALDEPWARRERTLEWLLVAGVAAGDYRYLLPAVDAHLARQPAPALRARRAALMSPERGLEAARHALSLARTPLTLWQAGRMTTDSATAITLLHESVRLAEEAGDPYDIVRNTGTLAQAYFHAGRFREAAHWSRHALAQMDEAGISDAPRRVRIVNTLAHAGIFTGDTAGLRRRLEDNLRMLDGGQSALDAATRDALAALHLADGDVLTAQRVLDGCDPNLPRLLKARLAYQHVRVLLCTGETARALDLAVEARAFGVGEDPLISRMADLAEGMALATSGDPTALQRLAPLITSRDLVIEDRLTAFLYSRLLPGALRAPPPDLLPAVAALAPGGLRALSGPEELFAPVWQELQGVSPDLEMRAMGDAPLARFREQELRLTRRMWEVLLSIALHPHGVSDEQLHDFLVGDSGEFGINALRSHVSRVRALVPITEKPYRIEVAYSLDVTTMREQLRAGNVRRALDLALGPILPFSNSPGIEDLRADLDEELRQAVIQAEDADWLFELAERRGNDLELWERTLELLPPTDSRQALARARVERLQLEYRT